jgi:hypothetical protein
LRDGAEIVEIDDEALLYEPVLEQLYYLNPSAALVLGLCDGTASVAQTAAELAEAFGADPLVVEDDVRATVRRFRGERVLVTDGELAAAAASPNGAGDDRRRIRMEIPAST